jgi:hypothetical protein
MTAYTVLNSLLSSIPTKTEIILGSDVNACIGIRDRPEYSSVLGPHGIKGRNTRGSNLLQVYSTHNLRVENTFFIHSDYATYFQIGKPNTPSMHDIFVCSKTMHKRVRNCNVVDDGIDSDHRAVALKLAITSIKFNGNKITKGAIDWNTILYNNRY